MGCKISSELCWRVVVYTCILEGFPVHFRSMIHVPLYLCIYLQDHFKVDVIEALCQSQTGSEDLAYMDCFVDLFAFFPIFLYVLCCGTLGWNWNCTGAVLLYLFGFLWKVTCLLAAFFIVGDFLVMVVLCLESWILSDDILCFCVWSLASVASSVWIH